MTIRVPVPKQNIRPKFVTINDIDSFSKVKKVKIQTPHFTPMYEQKFKKGIKSILGEIGDFKDWGGEINDLYSYVKKLKVSDCVAHLPSKEKERQGY